MVDGGGGRQAKPFQLDDANDCKCEATEFSWEIEFVNLSYHELYTQYRFQSVDLNLLPTENI